MNSGNFLTSWSFDPYVTVLIGASTLAFYTGKNILSKQFSDKSNENNFVKAKQGLFLAGIVTLVVATMSPVNHFSHIYLWMRIFQTLLVIAYGPSLVVMSAPWDYLRVGFGRFLRPSSSTELGHESKPNPLWRFLSTPLVSFLVYNVTMLLWLIPSSISFVERYPLANEAMHITEIFAGLLLWVHLVDSPPFRSRVAPLIKRVVPTYFTVVISWVFAMVLGFANAPFYHVYITSMNSLSPMADQEIASAILFIIVAGPFVYAGVNNTRRWMASENEYRQKPVADNEDSSSLKKTEQIQKKKRKIPGLT
ncbi:MAG: cytochrome c oxidase assembly protein [Actinomycetota bacterium]|nr:cytochrome c oxidase assembly protein [Actinomycetota bacterium]